MNHMEEVAKMLGVKFGEVFKIDIGGILFETKYYLGELGLFMVGDNKLMTGTLNGLLNGRYKVVKIPQNILTEQERNYLLSVIKPFREKILHISKLSSKDGESICIDIRYDWEEDSIMLPKFAAGTLYKGMEIGKEYSVKDLGL